jgi:hypothetical protein
MVQKVQKATDYVLAGSTDDRPREQKQAELKKIGKFQRLQRLLNPLVNIERRKFIQWKIKQFESRGNERKARIYRLKLKG